MMYVWKNITMQNTDDITTTLIKKRDSILATKTEPQLMPICIPVPKNFILFECRLARLVGCGGKCYSWAQ